MLYIKIKNFLNNNKYTLGLLFFLFLYTADANAETFGALRKAGETIFTGLSGIVFKAATIGIACVCIAGMFGSFNWKWFAAIAIAVFAMTSAASIVSMTGGTLSASIDGSD